MSLITPDTSQLREDITPGEYQVRVIGSELGEWQGKDGKPDTKYVKWTLETCNSAEPKDNGRRIWNTTPYTGGGAFRLQNFFKAAMGEDLPKDGGFDTEMLNGRELNVVVDKNDRGYIEVKAESPIQ